MGYQFWVHSIPWKKGIPHPGSVVRIIVGFENGKIWTIVYEALTLWQAFNRYLTMFYHSIAVWTMCLL